MAKRLPTPATPNTSISEVQNPRAVIGGNMPPVPSADQVRELVKDDNAAALAEITLQAEVCKALTKTIDTDAECNIAGDAFKVFSGMRKDFEGRRVAAKEPWLAGERAVDGYFVPVRDRIDEVLGALEREVGGFLRRKEAEERRRREEEARRLRESEEKQRREAEEARRKEAELRNRAELARTAEARRKAAEEAEKQAVAATVADARADTMGSMADRSEGEARSKPADLARTRGDGSLSTLRQDWGFEITDYEDLAFDGPLRPFIKREHIEAALKAFVKINKDQQKLAGVRFFQDRKANIR